MRNTGTPPPHTKKPLTPHNILKPLLLLRAKQPLASGARITSSTLGAPHVLVEGHQQAVPRPDSAHDGPTGGGDAEACYGQQLLQGGLVPMAAAAGGVQLLPGNRQGVSSPQAGPIGTAEGVGVWGVGWEAWD